MSVSATTRADTARRGRRHATTCFVDKAKFEEMVERGELLEWATVFDKRYGTPRAPVEAALSAGRDVLFDIDWQGTQQLREKAGADVVSVFILPPSAADLEKRLHTRAQDSAEVIRGRMDRASHELSHWAEYDYIVVNRERRRRLCRSAVDPEGGTAEARAPHRPHRVRPQSAAAAREVAESLRRRGGACSLRARPLSLPVEVAGPARVIRHFQRRHRRARRQPRLARGEPGKQHAHQHAEDRQSAGDDGDQHRQRHRLFGYAGIGGTARGMTCGLAGGVGAGRTSAFCSAGAAGGLAAGFTADVGSGQRAAAAGASMLADLRRRVDCYRRPLRVQPEQARPGLALALHPARRAFARVRRAHRKASAGWRSSCAAARAAQRQALPLLPSLARPPCPQSFRLHSSGTSIDARCPVRDGSASACRAGCSHAATSGKCRQLAREFARQCREQRGGFALERMEAIIAATNFAARVFMDTSGTLRNTITVPFSARIWVAMSRKSGVVKA